MTQNADQGALPLWNPSGRENMEGNESVNADASSCRAARREGYDAGYEAGWCNEEEAIPRQPYPRESLAAQAWLKGFERGVLERLLDDNHAASRP